MNRREFVKQSTATSLSLAALAATVKASEPNVDVPADSAIPTPATSPTRGLRDFVLSVADGDTSRLSSVYGAAPSDSARKRFSGIRPRIAMAFTLPDEFRDEFNSLVLGPTVVAKRVDTYQGAPDGTAIHLPMLDPDGQGTITLRRNSLIAHIDASSKAMRLEPEVRLAEAVGWHLDHAFINGDAIAKPRGFVNSRAILFVSRRSQTPCETDVAEMAARLVPSAHRNARWLVAQGLAPTVTQFRSYGYKDGQATLCGMPLDFSEHVANPRHRGILLCDPKAYVAATWPEIAIGLSEDADGDGDGKRFLSVAVDVDGTPWTGRPYELSDGSEVACFVGLS